ncbi:MAG: DUF5106 domain-containing protein, partial [Bacteroidales bacterium]|nr:DUF5106 domain-containing protein [Bacteroidales bacterium]
WNRFAEGLDFLLGNPNSNLRNEELYIPLLQSLIDSPFASAEEKEKAVHDLPLFKLNRVGQKAADFPFRLMNGRTSSLYAIESGYTILFFSNPGCPACREIMETLALLPDFDQLIEDKTLAVANIYPDEDLAAWREYASIYPKNWYNGYDEYQTIYNTPLYHIRAIPSVYLLDSEKKVILKDAPTELLVSVLSQLLGGE